MRVPDSRSQVGAVSSPDRQRVVRRNFTGVETLLDLQRTHGNAFVQRVVRRKLAVSQAGDRYEQDADRVAEEVVQKKDASKSVPSISLNPESRVQRIQLARSVNALAFTAGGNIVFGAGQYRPRATEGERLGAHELTHVVQQSNHTSYATIQRQEPEETQTALQKLDADLASEWTLDRTIQTDLKALSQKEKEVVLSGTSYRDKLVERLSESGLLQALETLGADLDTTLNWLEAEGIKHFKLTYGSDYKRSTPDGTLDAELERRMLAMCEFLILNDMVTENISLNWAARSRAEAHIKSTAYHIIKDYVTLDDLKKLLADPAKDKENRTHTARAGESLSLIARYPNAGWRDRLDQLIAANSELPSIRDRSPDDPRYAWLDIGDVINIPWATPGDGDAGAQPLREVRDGDDNLWYVEDWNKAETDEQARKNREIGKGEKLSLAYEGYEVGDPKRLPNSLDPTHPPVSAHVHGLAIDATILWIKSTKLPPWAPGWSISEILDHFKLQRPIMEDNPYGSAEAEPWHFEKL